MCWKCDLSAAGRADSLSHVQLQDLYLVSINRYVRKNAKECSVSQSGQDFGANDWLVEEMFERYQADPTSVPSEWVTYFQNNPQSGAPAAQRPHLMRQRAEHRQHLNL